MWSDEAQEKTVAQRQGRIQANLDAAADLPVEPPDKLIAASQALALLPPEALLDAPGRAAEREAEHNRWLVEEWKREHEELRLHRHRQLGRVSAKGLTEMEERLEKGEPVVDETGKVIGYRPIRTRDLDNIIATAIDKQLAIEKRILGEDEEGGGGSVPDSVKDLLQRLELLAKANPINAQVPGEYRNPVIDVTPEAGD